MLSLYSTGYLKRAISTSNGARSLDDISAAISSMISSRVLPPVVPVLPCTDYKSKLAQVSYQRSKERGAEDFHYGTKKP